MYFLLKKIQQQFNEIFICKTIFHPLRDPQLQFKSEKYKLNKNMEDIIKCNIKNVGSKRW